MKKFLSLMLAVLMLALPVFSGAETAAETVTALASADFAAGYLAKGDRLVTNITIEPGIVLLSGVPEQLQSAIQDLLKALAFEVTGQKTDGMAQGGFRLLLNGENALDILVALGEKGVYAASTLLGDKIVQVTPDQLKSLADQLSEQLVASGKVSREQMDSIKNALAKFKDDPNGALASMIGQPDFGPLMEALSGLVSGTNLMPQEVTELPEGVTIDAKYVMNVVLSKEALTKVTDALAKLLWSMPVVQQIAQNVKTGDGEPLTEGKLVSKLNAIPGALSKDLQIDVYMTEDGQTIQAVSGFEITANGSTVPINFSVTAETAADGTHVLWTAGAQKGDEAMLMTGDMKIAVSENGGTMTYDVTASMTRNGETFTPMEENVHAAWTAEEKSRAMTMEIAVHAKNDAAADPINMIFTIASQDQDLGDHAEGTLTINAAMENIGDIVTLTIGKKTDMAEAYIVTEDAVQPLAMNSEEMNAFTQEVSATAQQALIGLINKLPESARNLVMQLMGGGQQ